MPILGGGNWIKGDNVNNGDKFTFLDEGNWVESTKYKYPDKVVDGKTVPGTFKVDFIITVKLNDEESEYSFRMNKKNREILMAKWGNDTTRWVNHFTTVVVKDIEVGGEDRKSIRFNEPEQINWEE